MGGDDPLFRGRGRWIGDLALVVAAGLAGRSRGPLGVLLGSAVAVSLLLGPRGPAFQVSAALILVPLLLPHGREGLLGSRAPRHVLLLLGLVALAVVAALLAGPISVPRDGALSAVIGALVLLACVLLATDLPRPHGARRRNAVALLVVALIGAHLVLCPAAAFSWAEPWRPTRGHVALEVVVLFLLAGLACRGPWLLWTLAVSASLTVARVGTRDWRDGLVLLAGPLGVALAARVGSALRRRVSPADGDAAVARLARAVQWRPWRTTLAVTVVAFLVSYSFWIGLLRSAPSDVAGGVLMEFGFFAVPGPFTIVVAVLFHALARAESLTDRVAAVVGPLLAVAGGLVLVVLLLAAARGGRGLDKLGEVVLAYTGLGPLLPALTGLATARLGRGRRVAPWPAVAPLLGACAVVVVSLGGSDPTGTLPRAASPELRGTVTALFAVPWLLAFHRLVVAPTPLPRLLLGGLVLAAATGAGAATLGPHDGSPRALDVASVTALVACTFGMAALGVVLARRLRGITALPPDHAVLHWEQALAG